MKVNGIEFELEFIKPRTTANGLNFVVLTGYGANDKRIDVKVTNEELEQVIEQLKRLSTIRGKY